MFKTKSPPVPSGAAPPSRDRTVLVIDAPYAVSALAVFGGSFSVVISQSGGLDSDLLARVRPDWVLAPLVGPHRDILDTAQWLATNRFEGTLCAVVPALPDPHVVTAEVRAHCPGMEFCLLELPRLTAPAPDRSRA